MSSGSSRLAASSSSCGASPPRVTAKVTCPHEAAAPAPDRARRVVRPRPRRAAAARHRARRPRACFAPRQVRARAAARRLGRQLGGALEESRRCGQAAAGLCTAGRALELGGNVLVRPGGRVRAVPSAAVGIELRVGRVGERTVRTLRAPPAKPPGTPPNGRADAGTAPGRRTRPGLPLRPAPPPRLHPERRPRLPHRAPGRLPAPPRRRAGACRVSAGSGASRRRKLSSIRLVRAPTRRAGRSRRPSPPASARAAARAARVGCRASPRRSGRAPARRAGPSARSRAARARRAPPAREHQLVEPRELVLAGGVARRNHHGDRLGRESACHERERLR